MPNISIHASSRPTTVRGSARMIIKIFTTDYTEILIGREEVGFTAEAQKPLRSAKVGGLRVVVYGEEKKF